MNVILFTDVADTAGYGKYAGTYKLATEIRNYGYTCQVIDNFSWLGSTRLKTLIDKFITDDTFLVGFSCTVNEKRVNGKMWHWGLPDNEFYPLLEYICSKNNKIITCAGGSRVNATSNWPGIDYVVINKGDVAILKLIDHAVNGTEIKATPNKHSKVVNGDDYFYTQEKFNCSTIQYEQNDIILPGETLPMEIARGCIFSCAYCHFDLIGKRIGDWTKNPETIKAEMIRNYELYGTTQYMFSDELINESMPKLEMLANTIAQLPFKIKYTSYARIDMIYRYPEMREMLLETGAASLSFGIETFNITAGKAVGKGMHPDKVKQALHYCRDTWKDKIITSSNFIVGLPGETEESMWATVDYLVSDQNPLDIFGFLPLFIREGDDGRHGSKIDNDPEKYGYTLINGKWSNPNMSYTQAVALTKQIYARPDVKERTKFMAATWIGRILSLGYSVEEIFNNIRNTNVPNKLSDNVYVRSHNMKLAYYNRLLEL